MMTSRQDNRSDNQKGEKDWKNKLISSSLPLEFEVGRILSRQKFNITADYTYARSAQDAHGIMKDFSVDLYARGYLPLTNSNNLTAYLELLVECKQRNPFNKWLFLPKIGNYKRRSEIFSGRSIRLLDQFSTRINKFNGTKDFDKKGPFCYKGIEIDLKNGIVKDDEIKHGISQLQYALPRLISGWIEEASDYDEDINDKELRDCAYPVFFCPILLTTSDLFILKSNMTIDNIKKTNDLSNIAKQVPYLFLSSDCSPDFEKHCKDVFEPFGNSEFLLLTEYRKKHGESDYNLPKQIAGMLADGNFKDFFTEFVVCSLDNFPLLLDRIKSVTRVVTRKLTADYNKRESLN